MAKKIKAEDVEEKEEDPSNSQTKFLIKKENWLWMFLKLEQILLF